ncbi:MAG: ATP-dependent helicase [Nitrospirae bacterium CG_4_10_14_0_8_um_filter_41_23]|nr:DEAD/DEAH box helicase [Nitrospirota bacterium]PIQ93656.1 MAG: ATP-dependent helicase [Nitrospirae bacterium CG11_big_fil_rev_8_21_14_0_20_41_14]PIV44345.1 MAG: ATP-dependent helicase [Nitrospirae bacterium CG02_land_8_20_14_3_00_41_53]PIW87399.1 MAG: ATP-dependent helicase [Nitrospirae bacterium CG_4_8_14_3_um_filter_41_47]PIY87221.1 MAG: ATP-dependent helicase [Nitrospirae bacterium CG_4_10_14_0_8_um_filter_41_23]PJA79539.1 MAG: ATP-dependent helicase [Nitrospirae bacterium CG_4_9_14_3_um
MYQELNAVVMPNGSIQMEWIDAGEQISKSRHLLQQEIYRRFASDPETAFLFLGFCDRTIPLSPSLDYLREFAGLFVNKLRLTPDLDVIRHRVKIDIEGYELNRFLENAPLMTGSEYLSSELLEGFWQRLNTVFQREIKAYVGTVEEFIKTYSPDVHLVGRVFFHLVESKREDYPFAFLATYSTGLNKQGASKHLPLKYALEEFGSDSEKMLELLSTVNLAAKESPLIAGLLETGELLHPLAWSAKEAFTFLKEIPVYERSGILCRIPNWWKGDASGLKLHISVGDTQPSYLGMDALLSFDARLLLGDTLISEEEARRLIQSSEGLAFIKNKWVAVDPERLKQTLAAYEKARKMIRGGNFSLRDALRMQLNPKSMLGLPAEGESVDVSNGKWLESVIRKLHHPELIGSEEPGKTFKAELRPYQKKGVNWLCFLDLLKFGICLADDMGLGKTVQILALLNILKSRNQKRASLLVIPASLISNWSQEIRRFTPDIEFFVAHPEAHPDKKVKPKDKESLNEIDLVITTYSLIQKYEWLQDYKWEYIILDEAQAIKNPGTRQTRAVKRFNAGNRIAMTGTPIENRLSDLWSLFDFINPGLLGSPQEFTEFTKRLKHSPDGYARLRKVISPYVLRRLKTDKAVISDLPEKIEMKTYASLSKKQIVLYKEMVRGLKDMIENVEGMRRKGIILSSLMKFKQLCNHPDQYLGTGGYEEDDSGKFARLREICETIHDKREKALVFTQFREMTKPLKAFLDSIFGTKGLLLHGGTPVGKRKDIIEQFQGSQYIPFMVLSLKAGGVGLNLTEANHVIHFDRWWNPAVENQATDRAFRIGQKKNVVVHKFITRGTIEEKIDMMLEEKSKLLQDIIQSSGEALITEMDNKELMELFTLTI